MRIPALLSWVSGSHSTSLPANTAIRPSVSLPQESVNNTQQLQTPAKNPFLKQAISYLDLRNKLINYLMFKPTDIEYSHPSKSNIQYKDVLVTTPDGETLHGYYLPCPVSTGVESVPVNKIMLFLHGYDKNVTSWFAACTNLQKHVPINALIMDYRGYGQSTGTPSCKGLITDALAMYQHLINNGYKGEDISLYGQSLGSAVALELATRVKIQSIAIQSSYISLRNLLKYHQPYIPSIFIKNDLFNPSELIKKINVPILIGHGSEDKISPLGNAYKLFDLANEPKKLIILNGAGHGHLKNYLTEEYFETMKKLYS